MVANLQRLIGRIHETKVFAQRVRRLADLMSDFLPQGASVLDVGCGSGAIDALLLLRRPDLRICGIDTTLREQAAIPVQQFSGKHLPFSDNAFTVVTVCDVIHHAENPSLLLRECVRVAPLVLIKDHYCEQICDLIRLRFMDWVGNARFGVALPYNYWSREQWRVELHTVGLQPAAVLTNLHLYSGVMDLVFGAGLQFVGLFQRICNRK